MKPLPDSNSYKTFFCAGCQRHKKLSLLSPHSAPERQRCTTCCLPQEERDRMGILNPYENNDKQRATANKEAYSKPITNQKLYAITGEKHVTKTTSETI